MGSYPCTCVPKWVGWLENFVAAFILLIKNVLVQIHSYCICLTMAYVIKLACDVIFRWGHMVNLVTVNTSRPRNLLLRLGCVKNIVLVVSVFSLDCMKHSPWSMSPIFMRSKLQILHKLFSYYFSYILWIDDCERKDKKKRKKEVGFFFK